MNHSALSKIVIKIYCYKLYNFLRVPFHSKKNQRLILFARDPYYGYIVNIWLYYLKRDGKSTTKFCLLMFINKHIKWCEWRRLVLLFGVLSVFGGRRTFFRFLLVPFSYRLIFSLLRVNGFGFNLWGMIPIIWRKFSLIFGWKFEFKTGESKCWLQSFIDGNFQQIQLISSENERIKNSEIFPNRIIHLT